MLGGLTNSITAAMSHTLAGPITFQGYTNTPGDGGRCVIDGGTTGASFLMLTFNAADGNLFDFIFQNNGLTGSAGGISLGGARGYFGRVTVQDVRGNGVTGNANNQFYDEVAVMRVNQSTNANGGAFFINTAGYYDFNRCSAISNWTSTSSGWNTATGNGRTWGLHWCISAYNGAHGAKADTGQNDYCTADHCDFYFNAGDGISQDAGTGPSKMRIVNCNFVSNGVYGIGKTDTATTTIYLENNGFRGNGTAEVDPDYTAAGMTLIERNRISYTSMPYVNPQQWNFNANTSESKNTARAGYGTFTNTVPYLDIGASRHVDPTAATTTNYLKRIFTGF
jgi:hypothetical protein